MEVTSTIDDCSSAGQGRTHPKPDRKVQALLEIEDLIARGMNVRNAVAEVASNTGFGVRTLFVYRHKTDFVPRCDWAAVLTRKRSPARTTVICHVDALSRFIDLCRAGTGIAESYRQMSAEAKSKHWTPIASERTLRRELARQVTRAEMQKSRRDAQPTVAG